MVSEKVQSRSRRPAVAPASRCDGLLVMDSANLICFRCFVFLDRFFAGRLLSCFPGARLGFVCLPKSGANISQTANRRPARDLDHGGRVAAAGQRRPCQRRRPAIWRDGHFAERSRVLLSLQPACRPLRQRPGECSGE